MRSRRTRRAQVAQALQGGRPVGQGAQSSQSSQSAHYPQQQQQVELFDASGIRVLCPDEWLITTLGTHPVATVVADSVELCIEFLDFLFGHTAGRGGNPAGGAPGGG
ncbi:hypothetical protein F511_22881 [Dorcoceras hygrometricum]|uniref:Uncharacterized protein n=1 Tax=Dorcoceras hygrometricum TaxID=472368 RepID=A0A2Z7AWI6_9LAMI|nr:hypothetical protein F511_22881 [Dorcoceras hygrometricum]